MTALEQLKNYILEHGATKSGGSYTELVVGGARNIRLLAHATGIDQWATNERTVQVCEVLAKAWCDFYQIEVAA
jgi:hypothetical protein